jgi:hypothetical protein
MSVVIIKGREVNRPTPDPITSSVLDHATVVDNDHFGLTNNAGLWPSYNCLDMRVPYPLCEDPVNDPTAKSFAFGSWQPAVEGAVYGGIQCANIGLDRDDMLAEVKRVFAANEGKAVEELLLLNRFVATDSDATVQWDAPVDLTPSGGFGLQAGIAALEGYAAALYAGLPTLHMPRGLVTMGAGLGVFSEEGDKFFTKAGSKIAAGGGYDSTEAPQTGLFDIYATGEVYVERSETISADAYVVTGDGTDPDIAAPNQTLALAERMYRVAVDCFVAKVTVKAWG